MLQFLPSVLALLLTAGPTSAVTGASGDRTLEDLGLYLHTPACSSCLLASDAMLFRDDGLHGDGAAGDSIYGVDIVVDQPAGEYDWAPGVCPGPVTSFEQILPRCWCSAFGTPAHLWTRGPGEVIHFTVDNRKMPGWIPDQGSIACSHARPNDSPLVLSLGSTTTCDPFYQAGEYPATQRGNLWEAVVTLPTPGCHPCGFIAADHSVYFIDTYNTVCLGCYPCEQHVPWVCTSGSNTSVRFRFDESVGRLQIEILGATPALRSTWGALKSRYR